MDSFTDRYKDFAHLNTNNSALSGMRSWFDDEISPFKVSLVSSF